MHICTLSDIGNLGSPGVILNIFSEVSIFKFSLQYYVGGNNEWS